MGISPVGIGVRGCALKPDFYQSQTRYSFHQPWSDCSIFRLENTAGLHGLLPYQFPVNNPCSLDLLFFLRSPDSDLIHLRAFPIG